MRSANNELTRQRETIHGVRHRTENIKINLKRADRTVTRIRTQSFYNKLILWITAILLFLAIIAAVKIKYFNNK